MKIELLKLILTNFKIIRSLSVEFTGVTDIYARNGVGKTTLKDAFLWLLFGKDSSNRKDFAIKTLDEKNEPFHRLDHEVSAVIRVDGDEVTIKRSLREKWVKKKGALEAEFNGHETSFFWNDVPYKEGEYQAKIDSLVNEGLFKLITSPAYFNALDWKDRRTTLESIAGVISNEDVFNTIITPANKGQFTALINALNSKKTLQEYKAQVSSQKKPIKEELLLIPSRIDEANRSLPDPVNYETIELQLQEAMTDLQGVELLLSDKVKASEEKQKATTAKLRNINDLVSQCQTIEFNIKNAVKDKRQHREQNIINLKRDLSSSQAELNNNKTDWNRALTNKTGIEEKQKALREKFHITNAETLQFKEGEFCCPTCKRDFEATDIESKKELLTKNFNQDKSNRLNEINAQGTKLGEDLRLINAELVNFEAREKTIQSEINALQQKIQSFEQENINLTGNEAEQVSTDLKAHKEYASLKQQIEDLQAEVNAPDNSEDNSDLLEKKKATGIIIDGLKQQLSTKEQRTRLETRINELKASESEMNQQLANLDGIEYSIQLFEKAKMDTLETKINNRFQLVKFKLFKENINGGQEPCCETLINGVPFSDANTASKINAGVDIINVLCDHYGVTAPIFIDNRESVTNLIETNSQVVNLRVSEPDGKLRIEHSTKKETVLA